MELSERCIATLEKEGWQHVYEWQYKPGTTYPLRSHRGNVALYVTEGSIDVAIGAVTHHLKTGNRIDIPAHTAHSAVVGSEGVQLVVGEEIEGDS